MRSPLIIASVILLATSTSFGKEVVVFFAGNGATQASVDCWKKSAEKQMPGVEFVVFRYPEGAPATGNNKIVDMDRPASKKGEAKQSSPYEKLLEKMANGTTDNYTILGHSSGGQYAVRMAQELSKRRGKTEYPNKLKLVTLEGDVPMQKINGVESTCWYSSAADKSSDTFHGCQRRYYKTDCAGKSAACSHYRLVNKQAPANLTQNDWHARGFTGCDANVDVLKSSTETSASGASSKKTDSKR